MRQAKEGLTKRTERPKDDGQTKFQTDGKTDTQKKNRQTEMRQVKEKKPITDRWRKFEKDGRKDKGTEMMEGSKKKKMSQIDEILNRKDRQDRQTKRNFRKM